MKWGVYGRDGFPGGQAFADGLLAAGHEPSLRSAPDWGNGCFERFDAVALFGLQGQGRKIYDEYVSAGIPVIVLDYGYVGRTDSVHNWKTGYWQASLGALNQVPPFACPADRFDSLGVAIATKGGDPKGYALLCAQTPGDASHGMSKAQLQDWYAEQQVVYPGLVIRPHPLADDLDYGIARCKGGALAEALAGARLVVTYNSNVGHDALLAGVPVVAHGPAAYAELAGETLPSMEVRRDYFNRVAYGQWTFDEMREGLCQRFIIENLLTSVGPAIEGVRPDDAHPGIQIDSQGLEPIAETPKRRTRKKASE